MSVFIDDDKNLSVYKFLRKNKDISCGCLGKIDFRQQNFVLLPFFI
jgi:hypothetical protein